MHIRAHTQSQIPRMHKRHQKLVSVLYDLYESNMWGKPLWAGKPLTAQGPQTSENTSLRASQRSELQPEVWKPVSRAVSTTVTAEGNRIDISAGEVKPMTNHTGKCWQGSQNSSEAGRLAMKKRKREEIGAKLTLQRITKKLPWNKGQIWLKHLEIT